jgi:S-methylmethionine-dependent homocysteine/selenocysteine methylase
MTEVTLLDGGLGQELVHRAGDRPTPLWSTQVMMDKPGLVSEIHHDFMAAGARITTANTYAIHRDRLAPVGIESKFETLHALALKEAHDARMLHGAGRIAGSIGPIGASYRADIHPESDVAVPLYREVAEQFAGKVDLVICETVVSKMHAKCIIYGAKEAHVPIWCAFSVSDTDGSKLRSGESLQEVAEMAADIALRPRRCLRRLRHCRKPLFPTALTQMGSPRSQRNSSPIALLWMRCRRGLISRLPHTPIMSCLGSIKAPPLWGAAAKSDLRIFLKSLCACVQRGIP